ncbi:MFS transporter [Peptoniphilus sp. MSJ-1]|uniref:MFS transporter n=1 Tax=Peptoniphilus ovalis TaxID=2841503 RepID=A0ABS6FI47_9FIRM|nr:MFS transporter [Peptoniphilus ovalis]MBU5669847.1 MFS transporter [Peptoniphilus ovalis]
MRINNFLIKITTKINQFFKKHFGDARSFQIIISIIISLFASTFFYYYLTDLNIPTVASVLLISAIFFILFFVFAEILKHLMFLLKRVRAKNLATYIILIWALKYFYNETLYDVDIDYFNIIFIAVSFIVVVAFSKSITSFIKNKNKKSLVFAVPSGIIIAALIFFMAFPGFDSKVIYTPEVEKNKISSKAEKYQVEIIDYEGTPVNLTKFVGANKRTKKVRKKYFNKGLDEVSVAGRIYAPKGVKNAPILFVAHGNHRFTTKNYLGYNYLGKYLAKRGIAVVSVDMNMLNGFLKFGLSNENDARAVLLLENIKNISKRNRDESSVLYNRFDTSKIALMGHSRGAEAAAIAYNFNDLNLHPDNGNIKHDYNFNILGIISVAGTYDQYRPADSYLMLKDVNYLAIGGTNDSDVEGFESMLQYDNVNFSSESDYFKAAVYFGYGNHGNFNSLWKDFDNDPPEGFFLNRKELLRAKDQEKILCLYTLNFLENSFGKIYNRELFKKGPYEYEDFPETNYYSRYMESGFENISNFEEDYDLLTASVNGGIISFNDMRKIYEDSQEYGLSSSDSKAVFLNSKEDSKYSIRLSEKINFSGSTLQFDIVNEENVDVANSIDVELQDSWGNTARVNLKDYINLTPMTKTFKYKFDYLLDDYLNMYAPQTVRIPLEDFKKKNPEFNTDDINKIEFNLKDDINISLDNLGIST